MSANRFFKGPGLPTRSPKKRMATERQKETIDEMDLGYTKPALDALTIDEASAIIQEIINEREEARENRESGPLDWDRYKE